MAGTQGPPAGGPAGGPGRPGRIPVGYPSQGEAGGRATPYTGPPGGPRATAVHPGGESQLYEPYPSVRPARQPGGSGGGGGRFIDYPRHGRDGWRRWVPSWKQNASIFGLGVVLIVLLFSVVYATTEIPATDAKILSQTSIYYYADGKTEIGRSPTTNRQIVDFKDIPKRARDAVLAAEDHTFYENSGINPTSILRAAWSNARGNSTQGGSTITQQYVKNVYAQQTNRTVTTKIREFFIALKITKSKKKDDILEQYLNTIYFGRGSYGIQAASQAYFRKDVGQLNVSEAAYLAGIINAPSLADDPDDDHPLEKQRAERRWGVVMSAMVTDGTLTADDRAKYPEFPDVKKSAQSSSRSGQRGYLIQMAQAEAAKKLTTDTSDPVTEEDVETGGYKIVTTFSQRMVAEGVKAVKDVLPASSTPSRVRVGMAAINPSTGAVYAIYGGKNWENYPYNQASQARAEGGSTFKAFGLLAALEDNISLQSRFRGTSPMTIKGKPVKNFGSGSGEQFYNINLLEATKHSVNTVFVQLNNQVGPPKALEVATRAGLPKDANMEGNLVNVLGSANPHAIDMASVYATFADKGVRHEPYTVKSITKIETGNEYYNDDGKTGGKKAFEPEVIADLTTALQQPIQGGTGAYALNLGRPVAGKTGTSNDSRSAWFVGYTPQISVAVAMYEVSKDGKRNIAMQPFGGVSSITGGSFPVRIWTTFVKAALNGKPIEEFPPASNIGDTVGIPAPQPTQTQEPAPSAQPSDQPSATPSEQPSPAEPSPVFPSLGFGNQPGGGQPGAGQNG